jgi:hypothetical protein
MLIIFFGYPEIIHKIHKKIQIPKKSDFFHNIFHGKKCVNSHLSLNDIHK